MEAPPEPPVLERQTTEPKKRGRPKGEAKAKAEPKKRGRPPKPVVEAPEPIEQQEAVAPPPPIDIHALMEPLVQQYIAASHSRRESARRQRYDGMFQNMMGQRF